MFRLPDTNVLGAPHNAMFVVWVKGRFLTCFLDVSSTNPLRPTQAKPRLEWATVASLKLKIRGCPTTQRDVQAARYNNVPGAPHNAMFVVWVTARILK